MDDEQINKFAPDASWIVPKPLRMNDLPTNLGGLGSYDRAQGVTDHVGFFAISGAAPIPSTSTDRCDVQTWGPYGFHKRDEGDELCSCGLDHEPDPVMGHPHLTMANIRFVSVVLDVLPHGYILYFETHTQEVEDLALYEAMHPDCAKTLQEILRLLWEHSQSYELFDDRSAVAVAAHAMIAQMQPLPEVVEWLTAAVPGQAVERYFNGNPRARARVDGVPRIGQPADEWVTAVALRGQHTLGRVEVEDGD